MREADGLTEIVVIEEVFDGNTLVELVFFEEFARRGERPPRAKVYAVRIDKRVFHVHKADPTGEELLHLAGKNSANTKLYQIFKGKQPEPVSPTQHVDLHAPGVERFTTVPKDPREGASGAVASRRDFILPEPDAQYLDSLATSWSTVREPNGQLLLVIEDWRTACRLQLRICNLGPGDSTRLSRHSDGHGVLQAIVIAEGWQTCQQSHRSVLDLRGISAMVSSQDAPTTLAAWD